MFTDLDESIEVDGFTLTAKVEPDDHSGEPWKEEDGHGPVSDWTERAKLPGERVLCTDGRFKRYYYFAEAVRIAKRDGWGAMPYGQGTKAQRATRAAEADFTHLSNWCDDQWSYVGVVVTASRDGVKLGAASLWGIESYADAYLLETANDLAGEALTNAKAQVERLVL